MLCCRALQRPACWVVRRLGRWARSARSCRLPRAAAAGWRLGPVRAAWLVAGAGPCSRCLARGAGWALFALLARGGGWALATHSVNGKHYLCTEMVRIEHLTFTGESNRSQLEPLGSAPGAPWTPDQPPPHLAPDPRRPASSRRPASPRRALGLPDPGRRTKGGPSAGDRLGYGAPIRAPAGFAGCSTR